MNSAKRHPSTPSPRHSGQFRAGSQRGYRLITCVLVGALFLLFAIEACGRKDIDRGGDIKLRGEEPVSLAGHRTGDLLQRGEASWYGHPYHGRTTSNGETYDMNQLTAAHKTLPFGTRVRVVNLDNNREVEVRINDRGPFVKGRIIDLSRRAAEKVQMIGSGIAPVALYLISAPNDAYLTGAASVAGHWTVQVGSFRDRTLADRLAAQLKHHGEKVSIERKGDFYRVRIGVFSTKSRASSFAARLQLEEGAPWVLFVADDQS